MSVPTLCVVGLDWFILLSIQPSDINNIKMYRRDSVSESRNCNIGGIVLSSHTMEARMEVENWRSLAASDLDG
jgi:hypothetical protein